ncbi:hypothetical protein SAMN04487783_1522 [Agrococcus baldri]|uniref:Uncharacterized protein n=1 Tax=Agrococcus baldri TaxID=153730 RepID=A0AA94KZN8_9MICO|nr:hypothetical protein [Agrococcus baldri]SFS11136.1 hypothetical protein SAMN04487783_1522 [Agrococcus baldri]
MSKVDFGRTAGRFLGRGGLIAVIAVTVIAMAWTLVIALLHIQHSIMVSASYDVGVALPLDVRPDIAGDAEIQYTTATVVPFEADPTAVLLESIGVGSRYAVGMLAGLVLIWLAVQLLRKRSFGIGTAVLLGVLSITMLAVAIGAPQLEAQAGVIAIEAAGVPTEPSTPVYGESDESWVIPRPPHWQNIEFSLLALGVVTGFSALLLGRASRLQDDTTGLI